MKKGTRVEIIGQDTKGAIIWTGPDKFNEDQLRLGVRDDSGQVHWVSSAAVRALEGSPDDDSAAPAAPRSAPKAAAKGDGPAPDRGKLVQWASGSGKVFWYGPSKFSDGMRVGVESDDGQKHWLEASEVSVIGDAGPGNSGGSSAPRPARPNGGGAPNGRANGRTPEPPRWHNEDPGPSDADYVPIDDEGIPF